MLQTKIITEKYCNKPTVYMHETEIPEVEARLAFQMVERWGMVAGMPDGEDSSGRAKLRLATPDELVGRAFECARLALETARKNGTLANVGEVDLSALGDKDADQT